MEPHDNLWHSRCPPRRNIQCETTVQTPRNATHLERDMEVGMRQELGARPEVPRLPRVATMGQHHACEHITSVLPEHDRCLFIQNGDSSVPRTTTN